MYTFEDIQFSSENITGLNTRIATLGEGPVVLFLHGWPECWYSWRLQMIAVANAGYKAVTPDMPGFGETEGFSKIEDFNAVRVGEFILGLIEKMGGQPIILVAHDWGASHAWNFVLQYPDAVSRLVTMSVPLRKYTSKPPMQLLREFYKDKFFYQIYFQEPGLAEAEFDANPRAIISGLSCSPDTPREEPRLGDGVSPGGGWIDRIGAPKVRPEWISEEDLDYYVETYKKSGFTNGIHYYRNIDRNWELMAPYADHKITCPVLFIVGSGDSTIRGADEAKVRGWMEDRIPDLKMVFFEGCGHWIQNEKADEVNREMLSFLGSPQD